MSCAPCTTCPPPRRCPGTRPECRLSRRDRPWCPGPSCHTSSAQWPSSWQSPSPPWSTQTQGCLCYTFSWVWGWGHFKYLEHIPQGKTMRGMIQQWWPLLGSWCWPRQSGDVLAQWYCGRIDIIIYDKLNNEPRDLTSVTCITFNVQFIFSIFEWNICHNKCYNKLVT